MKLVHFFGLILLLFFFTACDNLTQNTGDQQAETSTAEGENPPPGSNTNSTTANDQSPNADQTSGKNPEMLFAWVDNLRIRAEPNTNATVVTTIKENTPLIFTGEQTKEKQKITLRNVEYDEPWLKVKTSAGEVGWVFGGAVKRQGEDKGTPADPSLLIDIPHFGRYDLREWVKGDSKEEEGGDYEGEVETFTKGDLSLICTSGETGEYGYSRSHKLLNKNKEIIKLRTLSWSNDPFTLTEIVYDFEESPGTKYSRQQQFEKHFFQLEPRPETVQGTFVSETMSKEEAKGIREMY